MKDFGQLVGRVRITAAEIVHVGQEEPRVGGCRPDFDQAHQVRHLSPIFSLVAVELLKAKFVKPPSGFQREGLLQIPYGRTVLAVGEGRVNKGEEGKRVFGPGLMGSSIPRPPARTRP